MWDGRILQSVRKSQLKKKYTIKKRKKGLFKKGLVNRRCVQNFLFVRKFVKKFITIIFTMYDKIQDFRKQFIHNNVLE